MTVSKNFVSVVLALTLIVYLLLGGLGLIALAVGAYFWHLAPYRRGVHSDMSEAHYTVLLLLQDARQTLPGPRRPARYFAELLCAGLMVFGLVRLENPGPWARYCSGDLAEASECPRRPISPSRAASAPA